MKRNSLFFILIVAFNTPILGNVLHGSECDSESFYKLKLEDPQAVYLDAENFAVVGDGVADDAEALQAAINQAQEQARFGIVFVPEGRYRIGKTVHVWKGIRLIGYGTKRPVFVLGDNTPGFDSEESAFMINFVSDRPKPGEPIRRANPGTFYSAISNINFEIGDGNPSAVAVRSHFAQHCYLAHIDFHIGSGKAGVEKVGNEIDDCRFYGGAYGIITTKPSPSWPFLMIDSHFEGQRVAAISTEEGGLTLVRNHFKNVPSAIVVNPDRAEELYITDSTFTNISGPALVISDENNARPQFNMDNVVCQDVPILASFRRSGKTVTAPADHYLVRDFTHGLQIDDLGAVPAIKTTYDIQPLVDKPTPVKSDIPDLPLQESWVNLRQLGAVGDGLTDDTEAIRKAIAQHKTLYLPTGRYRVTDTITLKPDTVLVGLSPITTQLILSDHTPAFQGDGAPKALLEAPKGGQNIVTGIGLNTGGLNDRAVACKWMSGTDSMMNDVRFMGGHGTYTADGSNIPVYNKTRSADGNPDYKWDVQHASLWVTNGGGGTFKDIWTPSPYASAGLLVSDTAASGRIYAMSSEHHVRYEARFHNVSNWKIYALQMEEEFAEGRYALPVEITNCSNLTFANLYLYRVIWMNSPFPYGVLVNDSRNLEFRGVHVYGPTKFSYDNTVYDQTHDVEVRSREIARLHISGNRPVTKLAALPPTLAQDTKIEKVTDGFEFIDAATVDGNGRVYFVDSRFQKIYRCASDDATVQLVRELPFRPAGLACDKSGNLIVVEATWWRKGNVYSFDPDKKESPLKKLELINGPIPEGKPVILPGHLWRDSHDFHAIASESWKAYYESPDKSVIIPEQEDLYRAYSLRTAVPGNRFHLADEFGQKTYRFEVGANGRLMDPQLIAEEGELDVAVDGNGNVYVAAGNIFVYDKSGHPIGEITVPERPATLVFGGSDRKTLYMTARSSLYRIRLKD